MSLPPGHLRHPQPSSWFICTYTPAHQPGPYGGYFLGRPMHAQRPLVPQRQRQRHTSSGKCRRRTRRRGYWSVILVKLVEACIGVITLIRDIYQGFTYPDSPSSSIATFGWAVWPMPFPVQYVSSARFVNSSQSMTIPFLLASSIANPVKNTRS